MLFPFCSTENLSRESIKDSVSPAKDTERVTRSKHQSEQSKLAAAPPKAAEGADDGIDPTILQEVASADFLQKKMSCPLCFKRFCTIQELRKHIKSHASSGKKNGLQDKEPEKKQEEGDSDKKKDDMLTNLLGVESEAIDEMIDTKSSAASVLGVKDKKPASSD